MFLGKKVFSISSAVVLAVAIAMFAWSGMAAAESEEAGVELQSYFSNANTTGGGALVQITAPLEGNETGPTQNLLRGETCAMIYVFDKFQRMVSCCGCPLTADGLLTLAVNANLAPNTVNQALGAVLTDGSIRIVSTTPNLTALFPPPPPVFCDPAAAPANCCDPTGGNGFNPLVTGNELVAWAGHIQATSITESEFLVDDPHAGNLTGADPGPELFSLPETCADVVQVGTGSGTCSCPTTGL
jgi:hypothetical protein